jgi:ubiquinone/menaquinone biosynthesis C-methylase UbiE
VAEFDPARHKREERAGYNLIAARYAAAAPLRAGPNEALLDAAQLRPGLRVLDVASGPGVLAAAAAPRVVDGLVVAADLAEGALAPARRCGVACAAADAERLCFSEAGFDRVLCGLGLMFFPHAEAALAEMRRVLAPGGLLALSVWGEEARVPLVACALQCLRRLLPPPRQARLSPFRFGDAALLRLTLEQAGFAEVKVASHVLESAFDSPEAYWQGFRDLAGGAATALARLPAEFLARLPQELVRELAPYRQGGAYLLASEVLIATGRKV